MVVMNKILKNIDVQKWLGWAIVLGVFGPVVWRWVKPLIDSLGLRRSAIQKDLQRAKEVEMAAGSVGVQVEPAQLKADAMELGRAYGVVYPWWNPFNWSEDEKAALGVISRYTRRTYPLLRSEYNFRFNRDLDSDNAKFLNASQYASIRTIIA